MPRTPDRRPGPLEEDEEIRFITPSGASPSAQGAMTYDPSSGSFLLWDGLGVYDPRSGGGGITAGQHAALLQLIHFVDEGPAEGFATGATKTTTGTVFPTEELWKRANGTNLVKKSTTWTGVVPTSIEWKIYDVDGTTVLATLTDSITYSGVFETSRTRSIS